VSRDVFVVDVRYTNLRPIGGGSYGFVCSADDTITGEKVAIKKVANVFHDLIDAKVFIPSVLQCVKRSCFAPARRKLPLCQA
jgi:mitogen-activated protein kinase 1/3